MSNQQQQPKEQVELAQPHGEAVPKKLTAAQRFFQNRATRGGASGSTMRYNPFHLFESKALALLDGPPGSGEVFKEEQYILASGVIPGGVLAPMLRLRRRCENNTTRNDVQKAKDEKIDNTGNFHWPAEEILAHVMLPRILASSSLPPTSTTTSDIAGRSGIVGSQGHILELGAGFGLAGFYIAAALQNVKMVITDGNSGVVASAARNVELFQEQFNLAKTNGAVEARLLRWDDLNTYKPFLGKTSRIIGADVLFFEDFHDALVQMVMLFIAEGNIIEGGSGAQVQCGACPLEEVTFIAPSRGKSLERWVAKMDTALAAKKGQEEDDTSDRWIVQVVEDFDPTITSIHKAEEAKTTADGGSDDAVYKADRHRPLLVQIIRK